ncbi:MAG: hypothetical protein QNL63_03975 [Paracoccaceae bacterium]
MAKRYAAAFWPDAVRIATTRGVTRPQLSSDLGGGQSTLSKRGQQHQHVDLMSGLHDHVEKKNTRLRKEVRLLREEREVLKNAAIQKLQRIAQHYGITGHLQRAKHQQEAP